jgi:hypothetical protein
VADLPPEPKKALDIVAGKGHVRMSYLLYVPAAAPQANDRIGEDVIRLIYVPA